MFLQHLALLPENGAHLALSLYLGVYVTLALYNASECVIRVSVRAAALVIRSPTLCTFVVRLY